MSELIADEFGSLSLTAGKNVGSTEGKKTWHWSPIEGLHYEDSTRMKNEFIRQEIARMAIYPEAGVDPSLRRKKAIVIGVTRAVSTEIYGIVEGDLIVEEMDTPKLTVAQDGETIVIKNDVDSKWKEELSKPLNLSKTENKVIDRLLYFAHAMIPEQGHSLINTSNLKVKGTRFENYFVGEELLFFTGFDQSSWWEKNKEDLMDAMWNKALQPVKISFKMRIACSNTVKKFMNTTGFLYPAFPLSETEFKMACLYRDRLKSMVPLFRREVWWEALDDMLSYLENSSHACPTEEFTDATKALLKSMRIMWKQ